MKPLKPNGTISLDHRAYFITGSPESSAVIAASQDGHVSIVDFARNTVEVIRPTKSLQAISSHPFEPLFAYVDGKSGSVIVKRFDGEKIAEVKPSSTAEATLNSSNPSFAACFFDPSGDYLWLATPLNANECEVLLIESKSWSVTQKLLVHDDYGSSFFSFHCTGISGLVSLWIVAGQDGQQVHWLKRKGNAFTLERAKKLINCIPPVFSPNGSEMLVVNEGNEICRYAFASMKRLGSPLESEDEDNPFVESLCYVDDEQAIASTNEGRVFLIDTKKMKVAAEVSIEGHETRPIGEYYPQLAKESGLATDITWFTKLGNVIVLVFRRDCGTDPKGWKDSLLWYSAAK